MSLFQPLNLICPKCEALITMEAVGSVNADRRPDLRDDIMSDHFQDASCGACGFTFRLQPNFNYLDAGRGQWIAGMPSARMPDYLEIEDEVSDLFATSYGSRAPAAAQAVGTALAVRLTFGWPAIREKLLIRQEDLDDVVVEMLKLDLLRRLPEAPLAPGTELRLIGTTETMLSFVWVETASEEVVGEVLVPRGLYDAIAEAPEAWAPIRAQLVNGPFVDMQKLYMGEGRAA
ncbi:CpXC domain-containing protein [Seohaeicola zhoushanensis]|uniref:CpXC domain-containing protein n=1 Tax=Seohaeicola zhoushanensis TaxID=1569283 RepID=A0A8J3GWA5_9RHOB|nr:CpXC domain-containing protein [Seohaeicola zhoushanensis]GHF47974.1 hypothetical protein GCM10017056_19360 [Seohaeicola zhoushanensis]